MGKGRDFSLCGRGFESHCSLSAYCVRTIAFLAFLGQQGLQEPYVKLIPTLRKHRRGRRYFYSMGPSGASQDVIRSHFVIYKGRKWPHITGVMWGGDQ